MRRRAHEKSHIGLAKFCLPAKNIYLVGRVLHPRDTRHPIPDFFGKIRVYTRYPIPEISWGRVATRHLKPALLLGCRVGVKIVGKAKKWAHSHQTSPKGKSSTDIWCPMTTMIRISVDSFRRTNAFSGKITAASGHWSMHAPNLRVSQPEKGHIKGILQGNRHSPDPYPIPDQNPTKIRSGVGCTPDTWMREKSGRVAPDTHPPDLNFTRVQVQYSGDNDKRYLALKAQSPESGVRSCLVIGQLGENMRPGQSAKHKEQGDTSLMFWVTGSPSGKTTDAHEHEDEVTLRAQNSKTRGTRRHEPCVLCSGHLASSTCILLAFCSVTLSEAQILQSTPSSIFPLWFQIRGGMSIPNHFDVMVYIGMILMSPWCKKSRARISRCEIGDWRWKWWKVHHH
jgi:hypothetical protein